MKKRGLNFVFLACTIGLIFTFSDVSALFAQTAADEEFTLEEITVTAMKRAENQQKVPIAMEVISAAEIRELGKNDIDEILSGISNAIIEKAQDGYRITVRGVTDNSEAYHGMSQAPPAVAINTDGVYSNRKDTGGGLFDIERVEVLYGPQSTMYSSNSPGGVVNVITAQPKTDKFGVTGSIEVGNYNLLHTEGSVNVPMSDKTAMRASFSTNVRDPYLSSGQDNEDTKALRLRTLIEPNDKFSFTITGELSKNQGSGFGGGVVAFAHQDDKYYPDGTKLTDPWTGVESDNKSSNDQTARKLSGQINLDTGFATLVITPSYSTRQGTSEEVRGAMGPGGGAPPPMSFSRGSGFLVPAQAATEETVTFMKQRAREKGMEARMTSASDFFFKWILGATYYLSMDAQRMDSEEYLTTGTGTWSYRNNQNKNRAIFANITYPIMDVFRVTAGYRKSWDKMIQDNEEIRGALPGGSLPPGTLEYSKEHSVMDTGGSPDYKLGFEFDMGTNSMVYADYSTSYRVSMGGGPGGGGQQEPEKLKAYSLGSKNRFLDNKLQLNGTVYYYDYQNYRAGGNDISAWLTDDGDMVMETGEYFREPNANGTGNGRMIGADISSSIVITPKDMVSLSISYIKSEWTDLSMTYYYQDSLVYIETPTPHLEWVHTEGANYNGKPMMSTPPWNINLTYDHTFSLWNGGTIRASLSTKFKSEYKLSWRDSDYPINFQESYFMEDFNLVYNNPDGVWNLSAYVKNITNYAEKRMIMNAGGGKLLSIGNPRTYGAVLSVKF